MRYFIFASTAFVVCFVSSTRAVGIGWGSCKEYKEISNDYQLERLEGLWYEYAGKSYLLSFIPNECASLQIKKETNGLFTIISRHGNKRKDRHYKFIGTSTRTRFRRNDYRYSVILRQEFNEDLPRDCEFRYRLLDTDYKCWAIVYACVTDFSHVRVDDVRVLLKALDDDCFSSDTLNAIDASLESRKMSLLKFYKIEQQDDCSLTYKAIAQGLA